MNFALEVVAETGKLQKMLNLTPIKKVTTSEFPKGKVTIRTNRVPTRTEPGCYTIYYTNLDGYRAVCSVTRMRDWSKGYAHMNWTQELYFSFNSGCIKATEADAFLQTVHAIEAMVSRLMRKESNDQDQED